MRSSKIISVFLAFVALFSLGGPLSAQERLKKVRITYPTESIAERTSIAGGMVCQR